MNTITKNKRIQVDLGCGPVASPGFIGVDRFILPGVGIAADLNKPLPFADNAVDLLFASHSLEHIEDLPFTMSEIYRVCKHGAQVCIVAPYYQQSLNFANPYHKQVFNEHTPRFWTNYHNVPIEKAEYDHTASYLWGLAESDNSTARIDMRILRMEFFYYPEYRNLPFNEQRVARKKYLDVCDQIMYNLVVIKEYTQDFEMAKLTREVDLFEPSYVTIRKVQEKTIRQLLGMYRQSLADSEQILNRAEQELINIKSKFILPKGRSLNVVNELIRKFREQTEKQFDIYRQSLTGSKQILAQTEQEFINIKSDFTSLNARSLNVVNELDGMRESRISRLVGRFRRFDLLQSLNPIFQQFVDDSYIFQNVKGFLLQPSVSLQKVDFLSYRLEFNRPGLCSVCFAPLLDVPLQHGLMGIELVSPENKIIVQKTISINDLKGDTPGRFIFEPILDTQQGLWKIRIFARDIQGPLRLVEWRKYSWGGFGKLMTKAFLAFDFS